MDTMMPRMECFLDDDSGYLSWIDRNPDGFVLNTYSTPTSNYLMLHRSSCRTITGTPTAGSHWTVDYRKFCGNRSDLEQWALEHLGTAVQPCKLCV
jgi:hypothetical protein